VCSMYEHWETIVRLWPASGRTLTGMEPSDTLDPGSRLLLVDYEAFLSHRRLKEAQAQAVLCVFPLRQRHADLSLASKASESIEPRHSLPLSEMAGRQSTGMVCN
jgi:hypothetical protein